MNYLPFVSSWVMRIEVLVDAQTSFVTKTYYSSASGSWGPFERHNLLNLSWSFLVSKSLQLGSQKEKKSQFNFVGEQWVYSEALPGDQGPNPITEGALVSKILSFWSWLQPHGQKFKLLTFWLWFFFSAMELIVWSYYWSQTFSLALGSKAPRVQNALETGSSYCWQRKLRSCSGCRSRGYQE